MSHVELIWGAVSLMVLGALLSMCMKCKWAGSKQEKSRLSYQSYQSNRTENQQILEVVRSSSISGLEHVKKSQEMPGASKRKKHSSIPRHAGECAEPRYKHSGKETAADQETAYVEPLHADYYNCGMSFRPPSGRREKEVGGGQESSTNPLPEVTKRELARPVQLAEGVPALQYFTNENEDSHSYENLIGPSQSSGYVLAEADIYENSAAIQLWKHSRISESSTDDEPDYINAEVVCKPDSK